MSDQKTRCPLLCDWSFLTYTKLQIILFSVHWHTLVYTTQVKSAFGARWLASSEVISLVLFTSGHRAVRKTLKIDHFSVNCYRCSSFWCYVTSRLGNYPPIFTSTSVNNLKKKTNLHVHWNPSGCVQHREKYIVNIKLCSYLIWHMDENSSLDKSDRSFHLSSSAS